MKFISTDFQHAEHVGEVDKDDNCDRHGEKCRFSVCSGFQCLTLRALNV